ncbi:MAG: hypothetical protein AAB316_22720, partial [Bacteroidota bacterium]
QSSRRPTATRVAPCIPLAYPQSWADTPSRVSCSSAAWAHHSFLGKRQRITGTSIWAEKILFLDIKKTGELQRAHKLAFELLFPLCLGKSADPHEFLGISAKEKQSYRKTGYPFSLPAFRPHVTLARLRPAKRGVMPQLSKKARQHFPNCCIEFSKICIYAVGPHGSCGKILFEQKL